MPRGKKNEDDSINGGEYDDDIIGDNEDIEGGDEEDEEEVEEDSDIEDEKEDEAELEEYEEIEELSQYHKKIVVIPPEKRKSSNMLTKYEMAEITSIRAGQIDKYGTALVNVNDLDDPQKMAERELMQRKCPLILRRKMGETIDKETQTLTEYYEYWDVNEMTFSVIYDV